MHVVGLTCGMSGPRAGHRSNVRISGPRCPTMNVSSEQGELSRGNAAGGAALGKRSRGAARMESCRASFFAPPVRHAPLPGSLQLGSNRKATCWDRHSPPQADGHEKSTPEGVLGRNAEPPPVDRTEGGRCAPGGTRTPNLLNRNQMLYPLSYGRLPFGWV